MDGLAGYLEKLKAKIKNPGLLKLSIVESIQASAGLSVPKEALEIKGATLYVRGAGKLKSELFMRQTVVLAELARHGQTKHITELR